MTDNVVPFPKSPDSLPTTKEEATNVIHEVRAEFAKEVAEVMMEGIASDVSRFGYIPKNERLHQKDWFFLGEVIEAMLYRYSNLPHHLHEAIEDTIKFPDEEEEKPKKRRSRKKKSEEPVKESE